jgi:hypothetical protein
MLQKLKSRTSAWIVGMAVAVAAVAMFVGAATAPVANGPGPA